MLDIDPDRVLEGAVGKLKTVVVVGYAENGAPYFASSTSEIERILLLLKRYEKFLMENFDDYVD